MSVVPEDVPRNWHELAHAWELDPWVVGGLVVLGALYARGVLRGGRLRPGVRRREVLFFAGGWLTLVIALCSPLQ